MFTGARHSGPGASRNPKETGDELDDFFEELQQRPEVRIINKYVLSMVYIRIGLKGASALALLWATVVLLGGFVSDLRRIDFSYLTIIAFIQAAGLSDAMGDARLVFFGYWLDSLIVNITSWGIKHHDVRTQLPIVQQLKRQINILRLKIVDITLALVFFPVVCFAIYGPILCCVLSLLRLGKQDYGIAHGDASKANLKPALTLFYCLSLAQGAISFLTTITEMFAGEYFVSFLSKQHGFNPKILRAYFGKTKQMCLSNPASTACWNLITYGVDLLDSQLPEDYVSGGRVLTMLIDQDTPILVTRLLISSPRQRIEKLVGTLAWRSPAEQEMRWLAARILEHLAGHLKLANFPVALECISSLLDQEALHLPFVIGQSENGEGIDKDLVLPGLRILENLTHDRHNCTLIYNTKDLLSKIVAPVSSNKLVENTKSNTAWTKVVDRSLKVVSRLMGSSGTTGEEMRSLIADNSNAVKNLEAVLDMDMKSNNGIIELQMRAIEILTQLALHHPRKCSAKKLTERALHIFLAIDWLGNYLKVDTKNMEEAKKIASQLKEKAGEALAILSGNSDAIKGFTIYKDDDVHRLTELLDSKIKTIKCEISSTNTVEIDINMGCRISAAVILRHLSNYVKEPTLQKVLAEMLLHVRVGQAEVIIRHTYWERLVPSWLRDIENPSDDCQDEPSTLQNHRIQQCGKRMLQAELLSLIAMIRTKSKIDFAETLMSQTPPAALGDFVVRLKEMVEDNMYGTPACLAIQKLSCELVIEFLQHDQNVEVIDKHNIVATLLEASKVMAELESGMLFAGVDHDCYGVPLKPFSSVLAKNAEDLLAQRKQALGINTPTAGVPTP